MSTLDQLKWSTMTAAINEIKSPNRFLANFLFPRFQTLPTETIEIGRLHGDRVAAPFVKKNGQSIMVAGRTKTLTTIEGPNIRISRPMEPSELLFGRYPGTVIFPDEATIAASIDRKIADELQILGDMVSEREEWMAAMALQNALAYSSADSHFSITFERDAELDTELSTGWDEAGSHPWRDFFEAKRLISEAVGLGMDNVILGTNAAQAFMEHTEVLAQINANSNITAGSMTLQNQFRDDGAILLGTFSGVNVWAYPRTTLDASDLNTPIDLIRSDYAEFVSSSAAAERLFYYAAIPDAKALEGKLYQGRRFSKPWQEEDPSAWMVLVHSRPFPVMRKPNAQMSLKVTNV